MPAEGPEDEAVGQDFARARQPGRHRLSRPRPGLQDDLDALGFNLTGYGCTTCIGNSGPAAGTDRESRPRQRSRRRRRALRQSQLRGPRQSGREGELSGVPAARRRLCARRLAAASISPQNRSALGKDGSRSISRTSGRARPRSPRSSAAASRRRCSPSAMATSSRATSTGRRSAASRASPTPGTRARPTCRTRPISRA